MPFDRPYYERPYVADPVAPASTAPAPHAARPGSALALGVLLAVGALLGLVLGMAYLANADAFDPDRDRVNEGTGKGAWLLGLGAAAGVAAVGVLMGFRWGWIAAVVVGAVGLLTALYGLFRGDTVASVIALGVSGAVLGFALTRPVMDHYAVRSWRIAGPRRYA